MKPPVRQRVDMKWGVSCAVNRGHVRVGKNNEGKFAHNSTNAKTDGYFMRSGFAGGT